MFGFGNNNRNNANGYIQQRVSLPGQPTNNSYKPQNIYAGVHNINQLTLHKPQPIVDNHKNYNIKQEIPESMSEQDWKTISSFPNYEVHKKLGIRNSKTKKILKPRMWLGYPRVTLMRDGKKNEVKVHRIVAQEFLANKDPEKKWIVNHKDGNRNNHSTNNLEWVTPSENQLDRWARAKTGWNVKYEAEYPLKKSASMYFSFKMI